MFVAAAKLILDFYGNLEVSTKHAEMKKLSTELHRKFNVAASEIYEKIDDPERCVLGLACVASRNSEARSQIDAILKFADGIAFARITSEDVEIFQIE